MKKNIILFFVFIFVLTACAEQNIKNNEQVKTDNLDDVLETKVSRKRRMPDFERPKEDPGFFGIVKSVVGNEVTILKIDRPQRNKENENNDEESNNKKNVAGINNGGAGSQRLGMMGGGRGMGSNSGDNSERLEMLKNLSTGEEKIVIPVGIKMLKNNGEEMVEAGLDDVVKDKMLMIWKDISIEDKNVASFVVINN